MGETRQKNVSRNSFLCKFLEKEKLETQRSLSLLSDSDRKTLSHHKLDIMQTFW